MIYYIDIDKKEDQEKPQSKEDKYFNIISIIDNNEIQDIIEEELKLENTVLIKIKKYINNMINEIGEYDIKYKEQKNIFKKYKLKREHKKIINKIEKHCNELRKNIVPGSKYVLSNNIKQNEVFSSILNKTLTEINCKQQSNSNDMYKYIEDYIKEYIDKNNLESHIIRIAIIYNGIGNINYKLYEYLVGSFKRVDIINMRGSNTRLSRYVDKINLEYGSSNLVTKKRNLREYEICINIDLDSSILFTLKYNNNAMLIDTYNDRLYTNNIKVKDSLNIQEYICSENNYIKDRILSKNAKVLKVINNYEFTKNFQKKDLYLIVKDKITI